MEYQPINRETKFAETPARLGQVLAEARRRAAAGLQKDTLLAVLTESGTRYFELDPMKPDEEAEAVLAALNETPKALGLICLWKNGEADLPSMALRRGLVALDSANADTLILLRGEHGENARTLSSTMPG